MLRPISYKITIIIWLIYPTLGFSNSEFAGKVNDPVSYEVNQEFFLEKKAYSYSDETGEITSPIYSSDGTCITNSKRLMTFNSLSDFMKMPIMVFIPRSTTDPVGSFDRYYPSWNITEELFVGDEDVRVFRGCWPVNLSTCSVEVPTEDEDHLLSSASDNTAEQCFLFGMLNLNSGQLLQFEEEYTDAPNCWLSPSSLLLYFNTKNDFKIAFIDHLGQTYWVSFLTLIERYKNHFFQFLLALNQGKCYPQEEVS